MDTSSVDTLLGSSLSLSEVRNTLQTELTSQLIDQLQPQLQLFLSISAVLTVLIGIVFIVTLVYRIRVDRAILRIDRNIQKLIAERNPKPVDDIEHK